MIGDWVQLNGVPMQVRRIDLYSVNGKPAFCCGSPHMWSYNNNFKPIPLTPELLEKNGFIKNEDNKYVCSCQIVVPASSKENSPVIQMNFYKDPIAGVNTLLRCWSPTPPDYKGSNEMHLCNLESVHELQHALKLCGIEKTIEV